MKLIRAHDPEMLLPFLHDADEDDDRIRQTIADPAHTSYLVTVGNLYMGAVVMRWKPDESELVYIGVTVEVRGQGYGQAIIAAVLDEARERKVQSVVVGTADASLQTIAFYLKCGFRMDAVRKDYFNYFKEPVYENGIQIRDMLMLRYKVGA